MSDPTPDTALVPARTRADRLRTSGLRAEAMPSQIEKAAIVLTAIGPELAGTVLRDLNEPDLQRFVKAITGLGTINQDVLDMVIVEFLELLTSGPEIAGGNEAARKLLASVLDEEQLARLFDSGRLDRRTVWERLNDSPVTAIANFLQGEHQQTATFILSEMRAETAASVLERLERNLAQAVVLRLARIPTLDPAVRTTLERTIEREFLSVLQRSLSKRRPAELIAGLMNNISTEVREGFLGHLEARKPELAQEVLRTMFTFDDVALRVNARDVAGVLRDVPEETLLNAMKLGQMQGSDTVRFILENLPRRLSERYAEDLAALTDVARKDGEAAQIEITKAIQAQVKTGAIRLLDKDPAFG